jgi:hypothetical protein
VRPRRLCTNCKVVYKWGDRIEIVHKYQNHCILLNLKGVSVYTMREEIDGSGDALSTKLHINPRNSIVSIWFSGIQDRFFLNT